MKKNKCFITVFKDFEQVHLTKDVGMIPMAMSKILNVKSKLIYWKKDCEVENKYLGLVELVPISAHNYFFFILKLVFLLVKYNPGFVNFYHMEKVTIALTYLLKLIGIKTYIKLDISEDTVRLIDVWYKTNSIKKFFLRAFVKRANLVSIEDKSLKRDLQKIDRIFDKIVYIPNSILIETVSDNNAVKENVFLIVGRIGSYQKNHELLFKAISKINDTKGWEFIFAGPIDKTVFSEVPESILINEQVKFVGNLNREDLFKLYARSKVFVLPSRWEGFSLALLEAAYMGCYILATQVGGVEAVTNNGKLGTIIEQDHIDMLTSELLNIINDENRSVNSGLTNRYSFVKDNFDLEINLRKINWYNM